MRVAISGSSGFIGSRLVAALTHDSDVEAIVGLDLNPPRESSPKLTFVKQDVTRPMDAPFREHRIDAAIHLAFIVDPMHDIQRMSEINLRGTENFIAACEASGVRTVVAASSATAYGAHADNPVPLTEDRPLRGNLEYSYSHDKMMMERMFHEFSARHPEARVGLLRPSIVLGPHVANFISRMIRSSVMYAFRDASPPCQFVHEDDAARAFAHALRHRVHGAFNIGGAGTMTPDEVVALTGTRLLKLPAWTMHFAVALGWFLRMRKLTEAPAGILPFIRYPWVGDPGKFVRETGFEYKYDTRGALQSFLVSLQPEVRASEAVGASKA